MMSNEAETERCDGSDGSAWYPGIFVRVKNWRDLSLSLLLNGTQVLNRSRGALIAAPGARSTRRAVQVSARPLRRAADDSERSCGRMREHARYRLMDVRHTRDERQHESHAGRACRAPSTRRSCCGLRGWNRQKHRFVRRGATATSHGINVMFP